MWAVGEGRDPFLAAMSSLWYSALTKREQDMFANLMKNSGPGHVEIARLLLEAGADPDRHTYLATPLGQATFHGYTQAPGR